MSKADTPVEMTWYAALAKYGTVTKVYDAIAEGKVDALLVPPESLIMHLHTRAVERQSAAIESLTAMLGKLSITVTPTGPRVCPQCEGTGRGPYATGEIVPCFRCNGTGVA